ncbi:MAG: chemotaxis protein CheW [Silvanigrellaceae bacterium]
MLEELRKKLEAQLASNVDELPVALNRGRQFLACRVAEQELLVAVDDIREIIMPLPIAFLPKGHGQVEGVIAVRGEIMPVLNLRRMLSFSKGQLTPMTRILIVCPEEDDFGLIVDEIVEFVWLEDKDLDPVAQSYLSNEFRVVSGLAKNSSAVRPILDVRLILNSVFSKGDRDEKHIVQTAS